MHNTHASADANLLSDIEEARDMVSGYMNTGLEIEMPAWLLPDRPDEPSYAMRVQSRIDRAARAYANQQAVLDAIRQETAAAQARRIQPVVPAQPMREIAYLAREDAVIGYLRLNAPLDAPLPITNHRCFICGHLVDLCVPDAFDITRVDSDSDNGYEAYHTACNA